MDTENLNTNSKLLTKNISWADKTVSYSLIALALIAIALAVFYICITYRVLLHSDSAMKLMLAEEMARSGQFFPQDWNYGNDLAILWAPVLAAPLMLLLKPSFGMHAMVDLLAFGLLLLGAFWAARKQGLPIKAGLVLIIILASGISDIFAEFAIGQSAYSGIATVMLTMLGCYFSSVDATTQQRRRFWFLLCFSLLLTLSVAAGKRAIATYSVPLIAALLIHIFREYIARNSLWTAQLRSSAVTIPCTLMGTLIGIFLYFMLTRHLVFHEYSSDPNFTTSAQLANNLLLMVTSGFALLGVTLKSGTSFISIYGALLAYRLALAFFILVLPVLLLFRIDKLLNMHTRFLVIFYWCSFFFLAYIFVFSNVAATGIRSGRYFIPVLVIALLLMTGYLAEAAKRYGPIIWLVIITALIPLVAASPEYFLATRYATAENYPMPRRVTEIESYAKFLREQNLHFGYATYWYGSTVTVLSAGEVRVSPIALNPGWVPSLPQQNTSDAWYRPEYYQGRSFLLLMDYELFQLDQNALIQYAGPPSETLHFERATIFVYPFNLATKLQFARGKEIMNLALPHDQFQAELETSSLILDLKTSQYADIPITVTNHSQTIWSSRGKNGVFLGARLRNPDGSVLSELRAPLLGDLIPETTEVVQLRFRVPPAARYELYVDLVQENVAWFSDHGSKALLLEVE